MNCQCVRNDLKTLISNHKWAYRPMSVRSHASWWDDTWDVSCGSTPTHRKGNGTVYPQIPAVAVATVAETYMMSVVYVLLPAATAVALNVTLWLIEQVWLRWQPHARHGCERLLQLQPRSTQRNQSLSRSLIDWMTDNQTHYKTRNKSCICACYNWL